MDSDGGSSSSPSAGDYSRLNDAQLRSAIRFAEKHLRSVEEGHVDLLRGYRDEIETMRRHLFDRVLRRVITSAAPLTAEQRSDLSRTLERRGMQANQVEATIRAATNGRTDRLDALTEIEAMALMLHLEREA